MASIANWSEKLSVAKGVTPTSFCYCVAFSFQDGQPIFKVGKTNKPKIRLSRLRHQYGATDCEVILVIGATDGEQATAYEDYLHARMKGRYPGTYIALDRWSVVPTSVELKKLVAAFRRQLTLDAQR